MWSSKSEDLSYPVVCECVFIPYLATKNTFITEGGKIEKRMVQGWAEVFRQNFKHQHQELVIEDVLLNKKISMNI